MTHDHIKFRSRSNSQSRRQRHKGLRCGAVRRLSLLFSTRKTKNLKQISEKSSQCVLIKRNDYSKLLCRTVPLASLVSGGQNKLKLHNLTVNLIIHSSVKNKKKAKRNETKQSWESKMHFVRKRQEKVVCIQQISVRQFVSLSAFWQLKLCVRAVLLFFLFSSLFFFLRGFSAFNFRFFCLFCIKWLWAGIAWVFYNSFFSAFYCNSFLQILCTSAWCDILKD